MQGGLDGALDHPAGVAAAGGRGGGRELAGDRHEGRALDHLLDQLAGAVDGFLHAADAAGLDVDLADQVLGLGRRFGYLAHGLIDLGARDLGAVTEATADQVAPTDLGAQLFTEGPRSDAALFQEGHVAFGSRACLAGHAGDFLVDLGVGNLQLIEFRYLGGLKVLLDQVVQRLLLDGADVFLGRLDLGHGHQHQHPLTQVETGDDPVVDGGDDAVGHAELRRGGRCALRRFLGGRVQGSGGGRGLRRCRAGRRRLRERLSDSRASHEGGHRHAGRITHQTHRQS
ncbi:hypothetical protein D3C72_1273720 [compost metagenome]